MPPLRFVLACLIMLVLPLQGLASATMAFCGGEHHGTSAAIQQPQGHPSHAPSAHQHPAHDADQAQADGARASQVLPDANHTCGVCASCCYSVAVTQASATTLLVPLERTHLVQIFTRIDTARADVPDKPPRT